MKVSVYLVIDGKDILCRSHESESKVLKQNYESEFAKLCYELHNHYFQLDVLRDLYSNTPGFDCIDIYYPGGEHYHMTQDNKCQLLLLKKDQSREVLNTYVFRVDRRTIP
jgi:hypothetical protein